MRQIITFIIVIYSGLVCAQQSSLHEQSQAILMQGAYINHFNRLCPQEKVYLHFDNTAYFQGETIWFSATVVKATDGTVADSKVLYVELLSPTGVVLRQQKLKVEDGRCHGSLPLIDASVEEANAKRGVLSYPSGYYEVRAYTRTMLNFDSHGCFSRVFPVYKAPEKEGDYSHPTLDVYKAAGIERPETEESKLLNIDFLPEGGHLIAGVKNRIAFKATDRDGMGIQLDSLVIADGTSLALSPQHCGMGSFLYTPTERRTKVKAYSQGKALTFTLPDAESEGYALRITPRNDTLQIAVATPHADATHLLGYTLMHHGKCELIDTLTMHATTFSRSVPTHKLPTGVYQFSLFDAAGTLYATRMLFINNGIATTGVSVTMDKGSYGPFEQVKLRLQVEEEGSQHLSLAVRDVADYGTGSTDDLRSYMLLSSELKGYIERPTYYFEADDEEHRAALDRLMLVQGWSRYDWQQMTNKTPFKVLHYTEEALVLDGWALHPRKDEPMAGIEVKIKLYSPDRQQMQEISVVTDDNGYWSTNLEGFEGEWDLNLQTYQEAKPVVARLRLERATAPEVLAYETREMRLQHRLDSTTYTPWVKEEKEHDLGSKSIVLDNVEIEGKRRYIDYCTFHAFDVVKDAELMTDKGEYTYLVADYLVDKGYDLTYSDGSTYEQFLNEETPSENGEAGRDIEEGAIRRDYIYWLIKQSTINGFRTLWYIKEGTNNSTEPSYLPGYDIDIADVKSIIVYDSPHSYAANEDLLRDFGVSLIQKVQKPDKPFPSGLFVVEIILHPGRKSRVAWNKNTRQTTFDGYSPEIEFYRPEYPNGPIEGDADYRRTIYWNPDVKTDDRGGADVEFYNNGYSRSLSVSVEGVSVAGTPIIEY
ncbi:MAG: hypothetical protein J6S11_00625 [Bacteroidaceae bacterium]|nr:hypothetical protein [Bacteroidaceae bacterium]